MQCRLFQPNGTVSQSQTCALLLFRLQCIPVTGIGIITGGTHSNGVVPAGTELASLFVMDNLERVPFHTPVLLSSLREVLHGWAPPPLPITTTSPEHVVYGVKLTADQSRVVILLFAHPSLQLDQVHIDDGWTRTNKRARLILEAIIGVKVDRRWLDELRTYWETLPAAVKHTLQHKHGALTEVAAIGRASGRRRAMDEQRTQEDDHVDDAGDQEEGDQERDTRQIRTKRKRRVTDGDRSGGGDKSTHSGSAHLATEAVHGTTNSSSSTSQLPDSRSLMSFYPSLVELYGTIAHAFDKYNDIVFALEKRKEEYAAMDEAEEQRKAQHTELERKLQQQQAQLEERKVKLCADEKAVQDKAAEVEKRTAQAENDVQRACKEKKETEAMQKRLEMYAVQGMLSQPQVLIEAVRQLIATSPDPKTVSELQSILTPRRRTVSELQAHSDSPTSTAATSSTTSFPSTAPTTLSSSSSSLGSASSEATAVAALSSFQ